MPKIQVNDEGMVPQEQTSDREKRWKAYVANYQVKNPVKFASKSKNHEFDAVPASFK